MAGSGAISANQQALLGRKIMLEKFQNMGVFTGMIEVLSSPVKTIPTEGKPVVVRRDLRKTPDSLSQKITMIGKLSSGIVIGDDTLKGNETAVDQYSQTVAIDQARKAARTKGRKDERSSPVKLYPQFKPLLRDFMSEFSTQDYIRKLAGSQIGTAEVNFANTPTAATTNRVVYGGDATATTDIEAADLLTDTLLKKARTKAENQFLTGTDGKYIPPIGKINFGRGQMYLLLAHPDSYDDLLTSSSVQQKYRETAALQKDNPLLMAEDIALYGVVVRKCELLREANTGQFTTWGSGANLSGAINLFLGAGALAVSEIDNALYIPDTDDYENIKGLAIASFMGCQKALFNGQDLGMIAVKVARTGL